MKPDTSKVKRLSYAELKAKREGKPKPAPKEYPKRTVVTSVSVPPELKVRIKRDIGNGSFSAGVVKAAVYYLAEVVDRLKAEERKYRE